MFEVSKPSRDESKKGLALSVTFRKEREEILRKATEYCLEKGIGYRNAVSTKVIAPKLQSSLRDRLRQAKKSGIASPSFPIPRPSTDMRRLLSIDEEKSLVRWMKLRDKYECSSMKCHSFITLRVLCVTASLV